MRSSLLGLLLFTMASGDPMGVWVFGGGDGSEIIFSGSSTARFTPDSMTGFPAKRSRPLTPTSVAKMTASAPSMSSVLRGSVAVDPWGSTLTSTPSFFPAALK